MMDRVVIRDFSKMKKKFKKLHVQLGLGFLKKPHGYLQVYCRSYKSSKLIILNWISGLARVGCLPSTQRERDTTER